MSHWELVTDKWGWLAAGTEPLPYTLWPMDAEHLFFSLRLMEWVKLRATLQTQKRNFIMSEGSEIEDILRGGGWGSWLRPFPVAGSGEQEFEIAAVWSGDSLFRRMGCTVF